MVLMDVQFDHSLAPFLSDSDDSIFSVEMLMTWYFEVIEMG